MGQSYLDAVNERVIVFDGAFGTYVQDLDLGPDDFGGAALEGCNEMLCLTRPDVIRGMHAAFFDVGVDAIETASFGSFATVLNEYDIADKTHELNVAAARLAREVADDFAADGRPRFVAGSIGPGTKLPSLGHIAFARLRDEYEVQAAGLLEGGVDLFLIETCYDLLQVKAAMIGCRRAMKTAGRQVPLQVQVSMETTGRMLVGSEIGAANVAIGAMRPDVLGLNCSTGPAEMQEHLRFLSQQSPVPISVLPNAGMPSVVDGRTHYDLTPEQLAEFHAKHVSEYGVRVVGGCCGTTPEHLRRVVEAVRGVEPAPRTPAREASVSSIYSPVPIEQDLSFLIVGERTNANGSKAFREAMLAGDWDTTVRMANDQIREGAHVLDVCVDYVGRDGTVDMDEVAKRFATQASVPLVLDSTETPVLEAGLQHIGGRAILNSANLEDGELPGSRFDRVMTLARDYGAAVICLLIDERGQARDVDWKLEIAHRIHEIATERYGLSAEDLIFDALTFPLSTGDDDLRKDAMYTIEAIRRIKAEIPGAHTTLGVSNVSFGLSPAARHALNSVFLHECVEAGLDSAIVHAAKIVPLNRLPDDQREVCLDLVWDRRGPDYDPLQKLLEVFADVKSTKTEKPDRSGMPIDERLKSRIIDGDREGLTEDLDEALTTMPALDIVNNVLLDGMKVVGELFGSGQMQLPFVLQSAETMKAAVAYLEPHMEKVGGSSAKGKLVLGTVKGDVHDIGKNLVDIIATNNGYEVYNLGIKVPISEMIAKVKEVDADAIGMSGLLVKSTLVMRDNLEELNTLGLTDIPVLLGGAALTRRYVERDLREMYEGRLFYGRDAFEGLSTLDSLMTMKRSGEWDPDFGRVPTGRVLPEKSGTTAAPVDLPRRSPSVAADNEVFRPPFLGSRIVKGLSLDEIAEYLNETALYRNQWQFRPEKTTDDAGVEHVESDDEFKSRIRATFRQQLAAAKASGVLVPQVVYGYFPVNGDGDDLVVWTDESRSAEAARFHYPRQQADPFQCIADFFRPVESGPGEESEVDYAAFHIVTMGLAVSEETARLFAANEYQQYLLLHGLGIEMTEALAEYWHHRVREEWGFVAEDGPTLGGLFRQQYRGGRYSWGYPACPDLEDNGTVAALLGADRLGIEVSEDTGWQYHPEQTTSAIICHHPQAKYFVAR